MAVIGGRNVNNNDLGVLIGGAVVLIASFLPWWGVSSGPFHSSVSGWGTGFGVIAILLGIAVGAAVAARVFGGAQLPAAGTVGPSLLLAGGAIIAALIILLRWVTIPSGNFGTLDYGARIGLFLGLIGAIVEAVFAFLAFRTSGETLPGGRRI
jgi:hypothetical protein